MSTSATSAKRSNAPSIDELYDSEFITKAQRDAYHSKNQEAITRADDNAMQEGISLSNIQAIPTPTPRTTSTLSHGI
jgi:hypothetical protein